MSLRKIIRFETAVDAKGMYHDGEAPCTNDMQESMRHPMPRDDSKLSDALDAHENPTMSDWYFGFGSKKQARFWIYKAVWLRQLHAAGIVVSEYQCLREHTIVGDTQAIFLSHESKQSFSILDYFNLK